MFGFPMRIVLNGKTVILRPPKKTEMAELAEYFGSMLTHMYTMGMNAVTEEDEMNWWKSASEETDSALWAIVPEGQTSPIGITGLHKIHPVWGGCVSGIVICKQQFRHQGYGFASNLARTWYAANTLNRMTIQSSARVLNLASVATLKKLGYCESGKYHRNVFREGKYIDTCILSWVNPYRTTLLFPEGVPPELVDSIERARKSLELAQEVVKFM